MVIKKLPDEIIAKIAAGEVITRPYNILKEILENSLDANATSIVVNLSSDALSLELEDNGDGIDESDLILLCKPHCTSKLTSELDLFTLSSYGFRGEALSSISRCAKIKVLTKKKASEIGYEATYNDTEMITKEGKAMNNGTTISVKNIFYNNKIREAYFLKKREELRSMIEMVESYAIYHVNIKFMIYIDGKIKDTFGNIIRNMQLDLFENRNCDLNLEILDLKTQMLEKIFKTEGELLTLNDNDYSLIFTSPNFNLKKIVFILFINGRLVTNTTVKDAILKIYKNILLRKRFPMIYLELRTNTNETDVNVHPSKKEVLFSNEEKILENLTTALEKKLLSHERKTKGLIQHSMEKFEHSFISSDISLPSTPLKVYSDPFVQSIDECMLLETEKNSRTFELESLGSIRSEIVEIDSSFFKSLVYVGIRDNSTILVQYGPSLLNCKINKLKKEFFKQYIADSFGNFKTKSVSIPLSSSISTPMKLMLHDYFSIEIADSNIVSLPLISDFCISDDKYWSNFAITKTSEIDVLNEVIDFISTVYSNVDIDLKFFNFMKKKIKGTENALKCFGLITTLKELYKTFERC